MSQQVQQHIKNKFEFIRKVGSGAYGHVWKVREKQTNQILALKKVFDAFQHSTDAQRTFRQVSYLREFNHKNIIKMKHIFKSESEKDVYLTFEYMDVDLHRVIREDILKEKHKRYIIYQIALSIKYLHSSELIHRDLKPSNVLLNEECLVKLCDFGLVRSALVKEQQEDSIMTDYVATRWYRAPELLLGWDRYSKPIDIWSFGCLIAEMFRNKPLFPGSSTIDQLEKVIDWTGYPSHKDLDDIKGSETNAIMSVIKVSKNKIAQKQSWFTNLDEDLKNLIGKMLSFHPMKRLTIDQILQHPYLRSFHTSESQLQFHKPILLNIDDSLKLSVKAYRQKIWKLCDSTKQQPEIKITKTQFLNTFSRNSTKRKSIRSVTQQNKSSSISKTVSVNDPKSHPLKGVITPSILSKNPRVGSLQRKLITQTPPPQRKPMISSDNKHQRYQSQGINSQKHERTFLHSNKGLNCEWIKPKKRSISTIKNNRRNIYNCRDYGKGGSVYLV